MVREMDKELRPIQMEVLMLANLKMERKMVTELIQEQQVKELTLENGKMTFRMDKELRPIQMEVLMLEYIKMES